MNTHNNNLTPSQVEVLNRDEIFSLTTNGNHITVAPIFMGYKCFDTTYTSNKMTRICLEYAKAFFMNHNIGNKWNATIEEIAKATYDFVEEMTLTWAKREGNAKGVGFIKHALMTNPLNIAKEQVEGFKRWASSLNGQVLWHNLGPLEKATRRLVDVCEAHPSEAYNYFD